MTSGQTLVSTHALAFVAGFMAAKAWHYDELSTYRELHESTLTKVKRWASTGAFGLLAVGALRLMLRASAGPPPKTIAN